MAKNKKSKNQSNSDCSCCTNAESFGFRATSASTHYGALVLSCIDPRFQKPVYRYLKERGLSGNYSQMSIAGAGIAAVAPRFEAWHAAVWGNIAISLSLHRFPKVILIQHQDCGAAAEAYGPLCGDNDHGALTLYRHVAEAFRRQLSDRHPQLQLDAVFMDLSGKTRALV